MSTQPASGPKTCVKLGAARLTVIVVAEEEMTVVGMITEGATVKCTSPVMIEVTVAGAARVTVAVTTLPVAMVDGVGTASRHEHAVESSSVFRSEREDRAADISQDPSARFALMG